MQNKIERHLFSEEFRADRLTTLKDPLVELNRLIAWEPFRSIVEKAFHRAKSSIGRPPFDRLLMFKIMLLQKLYDLSDDKTEFHITDRISFMRFLGLGLSDKVPDAKTIWLFRETLTNAGVIEELFNSFHQRLTDAGLFVNEGKIIDASIVHVPKQRNSKEENDQIKGGQGVPEGWNENKKRQKDVDARWTKKNGKSYYGYKNHVRVDSKSKLIDEFQTTDASDHDSVVLPDLVDPNDEGQYYYADSAYESKQHRKLLKKAGIHCRFQKKGSRNKALTKMQQVANKIKSKVRSRVEHVFGHLNNSLNAHKIRCIGFKRATAQITLGNLCYNIQHSIFLTRNAREVTL